MKSFPEQFVEFATLAVHNANRLALQTAEFLPIPEAVQVILRSESDLIGARVFFEPPQKAVYWTPGNVGVIDAYGEARKSQAPLDCTYFLFTISEFGEIDFGNPTIFENPSAT